jgi:hypothetical protein
MVLNQTPARAAVDCASVGPNDMTDTDKDGFTDYDECYGVTYAGSGSILGSQNCTYSDTTKCLNPDKPDLFVIWVPAAGGYFDTLYTMNPLEFISGGLGIVTHILAPNQAGADRTVCQSCAIPTDQSIRQKAVRVTEDLDVSTLDVFGQSNDGGTPNDLDAGRVFTKRIHDYLYILDGNNEPPPDVVYRYMKHTIAHEIGHSIKLRAKYTRNYGGYHYKSGTGWVMDQAISCPRNGTSVDLNIGTQFAPEDRTGTSMFRLK